MTQSTRNLSRTVRRSSLSRQASTVPPRSPVTQSRATPRRHRRRSSTIGSPYKPAADIFGDLMEGSEDQIIDPEACVRMKGTRKLFKSGILRFENAFKGTRGAASNGYSSAGGTPVCAAIPEAFLHLVVDFFMEERSMSNEDAKTKMLGRDKWFLVIVGGYRHEALIQLGHKDARTWAGYRWRVKVMFWKPLPVLRAFARHSNELNGKEHIIELTFYDKIAALKDVSLEIIRDRGEINDTSRPNRLLNSTLDRYSAGRSTINETTRQIASVALKLSENVIDSIGEIVNEENTRLANAQAKSKKRKPKTCQDPRVYRKIFNSATFKKTSTFFNVASDEDRKNTLRRLRYNSLCTENFKGVLSAEVEDQTKRCMAATKEAEKFESASGSSTWPVQMVGLKENLLRTTKMDEIVENNLGNDRTLLEPIADLYRRVIGQEADERIGLFSGGSPEPEGDKDIGSTVSKDPSPDLEVPPDVEEDHATSGEPFTQISEEEASVTAPCQVNASNESVLVSVISNASANDVDQPVDTIEQVDCADSEGTVSASARTCNLSSVGLECFQYDWEAYELNEVTDTQIFDQIICEPSPSLPDGVMPCFKDEKQKKRFAEFSRRMLVPGGCIVLITTIDQYINWADAFRTVQMKVMKDALYLIKDSTKVQSNTSDDPQSVVELAMVAWAPGKRSGFKSDVVTGYEQVEGCTHKRKFNVIDNIPPPTNRLMLAPRKKLVRPNEKSPQLYTEILQTFCPPGGRVLDPFANTFTAGISCLSSNRPCVLLESDKQCFGLAKKRLQALIAQAQQSEPEPTPKRRHTRALRFNTQKG